MELRYMEIEALPKPRARRADPSTSHVAAKRAEAFQASHAGQILRAIRALCNVDKPWLLHLVGATPAEVALWTGLTTHAVGKRLKAMQETGLIEVIRDEAGNDVERGGFRCWRAIGEAK